MYPTGYPADVDEVPRHGRKTETMVLTWKKCAHAPSTSVNDDVHALDVDVFLKLLSRFVKAWIFRWPRYTRLVSDRIE